MNKYWSREDYAAFAYRLKEYGHHTNDETTSFGRIGDIVDLAFLSGIVWERERQQNENLREGCVLIEQVGERCWRIKDGHE